MDYDAETTTHTEESATLPVVNDVEITTHRSCYTVRGLQQLTQKKLLHSLWSTMLKQQLTEVVT